MIKNDTLKRKTRMKKTKDTSSRKKKKLVMKNDMTRCHTCTTENCAECESDYWICKDCANGFEQKLPCFSEGGGVHVIPVEEC